MELKNIIEIINKKAEYQYFLMDSYTTGLVLTGTEIKSIREGRANLAALVRATAEALPEPKQRNGKKA